MNKIRKGLAFPSAAFTLKSSDVKYFIRVKKKPEMGDVAYGMVQTIGEHSALENRSGRIHQIHNGSYGIFVFGNRYAPDYYEGVLPEEFTDEVDLLARSGIVGVVKAKNSTRKDPTRVRILGYVCTSEGEIINTKNFSLITPKKTIKKSPRSKLILVCGTSMNSGKSMAAVACCWALSTMGHKVRASKVTGTASLKDILHMNDAGAAPYADFTYMGYPSTYLLSREELLHIFNTLDLRYANNPRNYWVVEIADGIFQRETAILLGAEDVLSRIQKLIFCAGDAFGAVGGLRILKEKFNLTPDAISGVCSCSPLHVRELSEFTNIPVFNSAQADLDDMRTILLTRKRVAI